MFFLHLILFLLFFSNEKVNKPKYRMKEVENEGELFFSGATDFDEAFK